MTIQHIGSHLKTVGVPLFAYLLTRPLQRNSLTDTCSFYLWSRWWVTARGPSLGIYNNKCNASIIALSLLLVLPVSVSSIGVWQEFCLTYQIPPIRKCMAYSQFSLIFHWTLKKLFNFFSIFMVYLCMWDGYEAGEKNNGTFMSMIPLWGISI